MGGVLVLATGYLLCFPIFTQIANDTVFPAALKALLMPLYSTNIGRSEVNNLIVKIPVPNWKYHFNNMEHFRCWIYEITMCLAGKICLYKYIMLR